MNSQRALVEGNEPRALVMSKIPSKGPTDRPVVSVITLTYNHAPWITAAIEGVLNQQVDFPIELIVAEDCSTDGTREIVFDFQQRYPDVVRIVTSDMNVGGHSNGLRAHGHCRGEFVAYCEGDDYWNDTSMLKKQIGFLLEHPDYGMVHTHANLYKASTGKLKRDALQVPRNLRDDQAYYDILSRRREIVTSSVCVRKSVLDEVFDRNPECSSARFLMGDTQRWLELSRLAKVKCFHDPMVTHGRLEESYTNSKDKSKVLAFTLSIRDLQYHYLHKYECPADISHQVRQRMSLSVLERSFDACDRKWAQDAWSDLRSLGKRIPMRAYFMFWGSKSQLLQRMMRPLVLAEDFARRALQKVRRELSKRLT